MLAAGWAEPPRTPPGCKLLSRRAWFWFEFFNFDLCFRTSSHHFWEKMPSLLRIILRTRIRNYFQKLIFQKFNNCHVSATSVPRGPIRWWHVSFFCHVSPFCHVSCWQGPKTMSTNQRSTRGIMVAFAPDCASLCWLCHLSERYRSPFYVSDFELSRIR